MRLIKNSAYVIMSISDTERRMQMRARVYDANSGNYYISEVYGIINRPGRWYIVDHPEDKSKVVLVEYLTYSEDHPLGTAIEIIDMNPFPCGPWINLNLIEAEKINDKLTYSAPVSRYNGTGAIWDSKEGIVQLLENDEVYKESISLADYSTKLEGWNYIESDEDISRLMEAFCGFHDAVIKEVSYISGEYYDKDEKIMYMNEPGSKQVKVIFSSAWADELEMILLAPRIVHLVPCEENYFSEMFEASVIIKDTMVCFYDSLMDSVDDNYSGTHFKSMGMMWRIKQ